MYRRATGECHAALASAGQAQTKHKRACSERAAEDSHKQGSRLVALEAAVAAAATAVRVAQGDDAAVREWLDGVLKQVERQVEIDEFLRLSWNVKSVIVM